MNIRNKKIVLPTTGLILVSLFLVSGCGKKAEPVTPKAEAEKEVSKKVEPVLPTAEDERQIRELANEYVGIICSLDKPITRLEEMFADDFSQMTMDAVGIQGKENNLNFYRAKRETNIRELQGQKGFYDIKSVRMSADLAVVFGKVEAEKWFKNSPEPKKGGFWETLVFRKTGGKWYLVDEQTIIPKPLSPKTPVNQAAEPNI